MTRPLYFCGDPHGGFSTLLALADRPVGTVVVVGDFELGQPIRVALAPLFAAGFEVKWVLGNHDSDTCEQLMHLISNVNGHPDGDLTADVADLDGVRVAGLGGVFKGRVWSPPDPPKYPSRQSWMRMHRQRWRDGLPVHMRDTIWHEDVEKLERRRADVLVSHEGPSSVWKSMGFAVLDDLAEAMKAKWIVHGHHHHVGTSTLPNGIKVKSLGIGEIWEYPG